MDTEREVSRAMTLLDGAVQARDDHRLGDAVTMAREAAATFVDIDGPTSPDGANALITAAEALAERSQHDDLIEAAGLFDQTVAMLAAHGRDDGGPIDTLMLRARRGVGTTARLRGRYDAAATVFIDALELAEAAFGAESAEVGFVCNDLGILGKFTAAFDDAQRWYERSLAIVEATAGSRSLDAATLHHNLAGLAHSRQRSADGIASGRLSVEIRRELLGDEHVQVAADRANLGGLLMDVGAIDEAEACFEAARLTHENAFGPTHVEVAIAWHNLAAVADARGDRQRAIDLYRRALDMKTAALGPAHPSTLITAVNLGYAVNDRDEGRSLFRRAIDGLSGVVGDDDRTLFAARQGLADHRGDETDQS